MVPMGKSHEEWLKQADYDMDTAEFMLRGGRHWYAAWMCHLSIEKAAKALYQFKLGKVPPKVHNLLLLLNRVGVRPPDEMNSILAMLNEAQVFARYPEDLATLQATYTREAVGGLLRKAEEVLKWIKKQF
jgi:HEPN domain-containing protein